MITDKHTNKRRYMTLFVLWSLTFFQQSYAAKIVNFHPSCTPSDVESVSLSKLVEPTKTGSINVESKTLRRKQLIQEVIELADKKHYEAIIINQLKVELPTSMKYEEKVPGRYLNSHKFRLTMTAELFNYCQEDDGLSRNITPFDENGEKQISFSPISLKQEVVIADPNQRHHHVPALNSTEISVESGVYGLKLGASKPDVVKRYGYASAEFKIAPDTELHAYGRHHWLFFKHNLLVKITSKNHYATIHLSNMIPLDDRFDDVKWRLHNLHEKKALKTEVLSKSHLLESDHALLSYIWKTNNADEQVLDGFDYTQKGFTPPDISKQERTKNYHWIANHLGPQAMTDEKLAELLGRARGKIYDNRNSSYYVYDDYVILEVVSNNLRNIVIGDRMFKTSAPVAAPEWQYSDIKQDALLQSLKKNSQFQTQNLLQVGDDVIASHHGYKLKYHFYSDDEVLRLYQLTFSLN